VFLEVSQGPRRVRTEDPVDSPGVETQISQAELQVSDVLAPEHRNMEVEVAVAQAQTGLDQGGLGDLVD